MSTPPHACEFHEYNDTRFKTDLERSSKAVAANAKRKASIALMQQDELRTQEMKTVAAQQRELQASVAMKKSAKMIKTLELGLSVTGWRPGHQAGRSLHDEPPVCIILDCATIGDVAKSACEEIAKIRSGLGGEVFGPIKNKDADDEKIKGKADSGR